MSSGPSRPCGGSADRVRGKTAGGIIIPDTAKEKPMEGKVIAVGGGARDEQGKVQPLDVKAGDAVLFGKWSGTEVKIDGQTDHEGIRHHGDHRADTRRPT